MRLTFTIYTLFFLLSVGNTNIFAKENNSLPNDKTGTQNELETRNAELWALLNEEIKTIEAVKGSLGQDLDYRLFHLYSERLALIKEKENRNFLNASTTGKLAKKESYFKESAAEYVKINKYGLKLIERYKNFTHTAEIFYTLANNSRDYGSDNFAGKYYKHALGSPGLNEKLKHNVYIGLAEYQYNQKNYNECITSYQEVLKNGKDEWMARHLLNYGWCNLKLKNNNRAIGSLLKAFELGRSGQFLSVEEQVLTALAAFFAMGGRSEEGLTFFKKHLKDPTPYLIKLSRFAAENGQYKEAEQALNDAVTYEKSRKPIINEQLAEIYLKQLDLFKNFKNEEQYFKTVGTLHNLLIEVRNNKSLLRIEPERMDEFVEKIQTQAGHYQMDLVKRFGHDKSINEVNLNRVLTYFSYLSELLPNMKGYYFYYSGETLLALSKINKAADYYKKAIENDMALKSHQPIQGITESPKKDEDTKEKIKSDIFFRLERSFTGFFTSINSIDFDKTKFNALELFGLESYILMFPEKKDSINIYESLFAIYLRDKKPTNAELLISKYHDHFPDRLDWQKKQFLALIDYNIKLKNTDELNRLIAIMPQNPFQFTKVETEKAIVILGNLLFESCLALEKKGQGDLAIKKLIELSDNNVYPTSVRAKSAYNAAVMLIDTQNGLSAFEQSMSALKLFNENEVKEYEVRITSIAEFLYLMQFNSEAISLAHSLCERICSIELLNKIVIWEVHLGKGAQTFSLLYKILDQYEYKNKLPVDQQKVYKPLHTYLHNDNSKLFEYLWNWTLLIYRDNVMTKKLADAQLIINFLNRSSHILTSYGDQIEAQIIAPTFDLMVNYSFNSLRETSDIGKNSRIFIESLRIFSENSGISSNLKNSSVSQLTQFIDMAKWCEDNFISQGEEFGDKLIPEKNLSDLEQSLSPFDGDKFNLAINNFLGNLQTKTSEYEAKLATLSAKNKEYFSPIILGYLSLLYLDSLRKFQGNNFKEAPKELIGQIRPLWKQIGDKGQSYLSQYLKFRSPGALVNTTYPFNQNLSRLDHKLRQGPNQKSERTPSSIIPHNITEVMSRESFELQPIFIDNIRNDSHENK